MNYEEQEERHVHVLDICFNVYTTKDDPEDLTPQEIREALLQRLENLKDHELHEVVGFVDSYED